MANGFNVLSTKIMIKTIFVVEKFVFFRIIRSYMLSPWYVYKYK